MRPRGKGLMELLLHLPHVKDATRCPKYSPRLKQSYQVALLLGDVLTFPVKKRHRRKVDLWVETYSSHTHVLPSPYLLKD